MAEQALLFRQPEARALFSPCTRHDRPCPESCTGRLYRYRLYWPTGVQNQRTALWILANPSTADARDPDPTVGRCIGYSRQWGFGWAAVANVRAWRETDPDLVPTDPVAIGPENDFHVADMVRTADLVICGWGKLGGVLGPPVIEMVRGLGKVPHALHQNGDGSPGHPLYLSASLKPFPLEGK